MQSLSAFSLAHLETISVCQSTCLIKGILSLSLAMYIQMLLAEVDITALLVLLEVHVMKLMASKQWCSHLSAVLLSSYAPAPSSLYHSMCIF